MPEVSLIQWKRFLQNNPDVHLLQTGEWGELKSAFGWEVQRLICGAAGAQILFRKLPFGLTVGYVPKPRLRSEQPSRNWPPSGFSDQLWGEIDSVCRAKHTVFLKIEPDEWVSGAPVRQSAMAMPGPGDYGLRISPHNIQPPRTLIIDLRGPEGEVLGRMKQKCRYNIRLAQKKGVTVRVWDDLDGFHRMMQLTGGRDGFHIHSAEYYRRAYELFHAPGLCELFVAEHAGKPLAALMIFACGRRAWYVYGASNDEERNRMPAYLLQWEAMRWARALGCDEYDLWGVPDAEEVTLEAGFERRKDGLWGVYRFKRGFGGELRRAAQAMDRIYNPYLYRLYLRLMAGRDSL